MKGTLLRKLLFFSLIVWFYFLNVFISWTYRTSRISLHYILLRKKANKAEPIVVLKPRRDVTRVPVVPKKDIWYVQDRNYFSRI